MLIYVLIIDCRESHFHTFCRQIRQFAKMGGIKLILEASVVEVLPLESITWVRCASRALAMFVQAGLSNNLKAAISLQMSTVNSNVDCCALQPVSLITRLHLYLK